MHSSGEPTDDPQLVGEVWLLLGHKGGDNAQVRALGASLGVSCVERHLHYRRTELLSNLLLGPNLLGLRADARDVLRPPWPRLVITAGRRNEPVARWIRRQSAGRTRLVHIGRPWAAPACFDLIVTTPQYELATGGNVLGIALPLGHRKSSAADEGEATWRARLAELPSPRIALLIGGTSGMFRFDGDKASRLAQAADRLARELGGSLLVTTSPRTPAFVATRIERELRVPAWVYRWRPDARDNPYSALLRIAERFVVTGESMSMLADACATRKPVYIFDMHDRPRDGLSNRLRAIRNALGYRAWTHHLAQRLGPRRMRRDVGRMHAQLIAAGRAVWLGDRFPNTRPPPLPDTEAVTRRVCELLETQGGI